MSTKGQTVNQAYQWLRISGLTTIPSPTELATALYALETMMAEFYENQALNVGYNFEEVPKLNSQTNVSLGNQNMMDLNLAVRVAAIFGKDIPKELAGPAAVSFSRSLGTSVMDNTRMIQPSRRMARGSGWTFRYPFYNRFQIPAPVPPVAASTNYIWQGERLNYFEDFSAFLGTATIVSYTIVCNPLLTIISSAIDGPRIIYTITAPTQPPITTGPAQQVEITITDSLNRTELRLINFGVGTPPRFPD